MAQTDWAIFDGSMDKDEGGNDSWFGVNIRRLVTSGVTKPEGSSGSFVFGFNSLGTASGAVALGCALDKFAPIEPPDSQGGGSIRGCIKRGVGGGRTGFSPFFFIGAQTNNINAQAYILGLEDANPSRIVLAKGQIMYGVPSVTTPYTTKILRYSSEGYEWDIWHHLRLDMIVNVNGANSDVILRAYRSPVGEMVEGNLIGCDNPIWTAIDFDDDLDTLHGAGAFIDDALGVNTEAIPLSVGYVGFGFKSSNVARRAYFDYLEVMRQSPIVV